MKTLEGRQYYIPDAVQLGVHAAFGVADQPPKLPLWMTRLQTEPLLSHDIGPFEDGAKGMNELSIGPDCPTS